MPDNDYKYIWRCAKCSNHFANIQEAEGLIKIEKKCPKCKSLNILTLSNKEIIIHCKCFDPETNSLKEESPQEEEYS